MGVKLVQESKTKEVDLLKDVNVEYVSLVKHGANRMPFRVVKSQSEGGDDSNMRYAIQSILLPKGTSLEDITAMKGLEYLADARTEKQEFDGYDKLHQIDPKMFDAETMQLLKVGDGWLLVGKLSEKADVDEALTLGKEQVEKLAEIPMSPMDSIIGDPDAAAQQALAMQFRELFEKELYAMLDVVHGSLKQAGTDPKKRKSTIISAIDGFKSFLIVGLDAIGNSAAKMEKTDDKGVEDMDLNSQEFKDAVAGIVKELAPDIAKDAATEALKTFKAELDKAPTTDDTTPDDTTQDQPKAKAEDNPLLDVVNQLSEKVENLSNQLNTDPAATDEEDDAEAKAKADAEAKAAEEKRKAEQLVEPEKKWNDKKIDTGVFRGLLTGSKA